MKTMNLKMLSAAVAMIGCVAAPALANAQVRSYDYYRQRDRGDFRYRNTREFIDRLERESNSFRETFERNYDRWRDRYNMRRDRGDRRAFQDVQRMDEAFERLRRVADDRNLRSGRDEVEDIVRYAKNVDRIFSRDSEARSFGQGNWWHLRGGINELARIYHVGGLNRW